MVLKRTARVIFLDSVESRMAKLDIIPNAEAGSERSIWSVSSSIF
jgi:hypothetical protein